MLQLSYTAIGNQNAIVIPDDVGSRLDFNEGDTIQAIETPAGIFLCKVDPETAEQLDIAREVMEQRRDALRRLAE
jgi:putative addiction module antidote